MSASDNFETSAILAAVMIETEVKAILAKAKGLVLCGLKYVPTETKNSFIVRGTPTDPTQGMSKDLHTIQNVNQYTLLKILDEAKQKLTSDLNLRFEERREEPRPSAPQL